MSETELITITTWITMTAAACTSFFMWRTGVHAEFLRIFQWTGAVAMAVVALAQGIKLWVIA